MVDMAHVAGLVAAGEYPSPVPHADFVTTTTHKTLRGPRAGLILCSEQYATAIDKAIMPGIQGGPLMHVIAAKAVCLQEALQPGFKTYQQQIRNNATALAEGLIAGGLRLVTGGTDNHLMLVDLTPADITGKEGEESAGKHRRDLQQEPDSLRPAPAAVTSGIRLGMPAVTTRGMGEDEMRASPTIITTAVAERDDARGTCMHCAGAWRICAVAFRFIRIEPPRRRILAGELRRITRSGRRMSLQLHFKAKSSCK